MIDQFIQTQGLPSYRRQQFNLAYYQQLINSYDDLTTWSKDLRQQLTSTLPFSTLTPLNQQISAKDQTTKFLFKTSSGHLIESVLMRYQDGRNSVCVSCMAGCPVGCTFCATGKLGFQANLTSREIVDQILHFARLLKQQDQQVTNIVFMGMGEPLLNLTQVWPAIQTLTDPDKFGLGQRRITVSTSGYADQLQLLLDKGFKGRLAISLHAPSQTLRQQLMPHAAKANTLDKLFESIDQYTDRTQRRVSYEYVMIQGVNDHIRQAHELVNLLRDRLSHLNLIPYNPIGDTQYTRSSKKRIRTFTHILSSHQIPHTVRVTMGDDIDAACGQLAANNKPSVSTPISPSN